ncbi:MAG TPA: RsmB/NOP family class I SAM-dependent RNA methyltransferase [Deinococcales bacterium]|nr:RsmB/NOP family class I SAM-dependent RNA methyltransferase [Deinococcales bacterium]
MPPPRQSPTSCTSSQPRGTEPISRAARRAALDVHRRVLRGAFAAPALDAALTDLPDGRDRAFVTDLTYGSLRWDLYLTAALQPLLKAPHKLPDLVHSALTLGAYELLRRQEARFAVVNEWVAIVKKREPRLAGLVNAVLRRVAEPEDADAATALSLPTWLYGEFQASLGEDASQAAAGLLEPAPLWLTEVHAGGAEALSAEGHEVRPGPVMGSLAVRLTGSLSKTTAYRDGLVQPMNPSSLLAARLAEASGSGPVLDLASGNGIKAAVLAAAGREVTSVELQENKLKRAARNQRRLGVNVRHVQADLTAVPPDLEPQKTVLLDAPCTGTGTLRGNPEIKLRLTPESVTGAAALQRQLLKSAAQLTAPGGVLLYAVCSLTNAEGPANADWFLATHPQFQAEPVTAAAEQLSGTAQETPALRPAGAGTFVLPVSGLDGFYLSLFRRVS